ncbi:NUDIX domain-containing protein [Alphaproteobacteria bacterium]|nr:NUDIX domain-containing protein [Alphaproteobacteria bacterium]
MKVVAAILIYNKKVLAFKRPYVKGKSFLSLKYEFPGGKIKKYETEVDALKRELKEELDLSVYNLKKYFSSSFDYIKYKVSISFYISFLNSLNFKLNFHDEYRIVEVKDLNNLEWLKGNYEVIDYIRRNGFIKN